MNILKAVIVFKQILAPQKFHKFQLQQLWRSGPLVLQPPPCHWPVLLPAPHNNLQRTQLDGSLRSQSQGWGDPLFSAWKCWKTEPNVDVGVFFCISSFYAWKNTRKKSAKWPCIIFGCGLIYQHITLNWNWAAIRGCTPKHLLRIARVDLWPCTYSHAPNPGLSIHFPFHSRFVLLHLICSLHLPWQQWRNSRWADGQHPWKIIEHLSDQRLPWGTSSIHQHRERRHRTGQEEDRVKPPYHLPPSSTRPTIRRSHREGYQTQRPKTVSGQGWLPWFLMTITRHKVAVVCSGNGGDGTALV